MIEHEDVRPILHKRAPIFPHGSEVQYQLGERYPSPTALVSYSFGTTRNLLISLDYHDTLTTLEEKTIPTIDLKEIKQQIVRLQFMLGDKFDAVINTSGTRENIQTDTGLTIIARNGLELHPVHSADTTLLNPSILEDFTATLNEIAGHITESQIPLQMIQQTKDYVKLLPSDKTLQATTAREVLEKTVSKEEADKLLFYWDEQKKVISVHPRTSKQDGASRFVALKGKAPAETTIIHFGDTYSDLPIAGSPFGQNFFIAPSNASPSITRFASYTSGLASPSAVPRVLGDLADAVGQRVVNETVAKLSKITPDDQDYVEAIHEAQRWFVVTTKRLLDAFHVIPTTNLIFEHLDTMFGVTLTEQQRSLLIQNIFDFNTDINAQLADLIGINPSEYQRQYREDLFDNHPLTHHIETFPGMHIIAARGTETNQVLFDATSAPPEQESEALAASAKIVDEATKRLLASFGDEINNVVLLSLFRGGIYPSIGVQQMILHKTGFDLPHYAIVPRKLKRGKDSEKKEDMTLQFSFAGEDIAYILDKHPKANLLFLDGWVGSGEVIIKLREAFTRMKDAAGFKNDFYFTTLLDPLGVSDFTGTTEDQIFGWNLWEHNDKTCAFLHRTHDNKETGLVPINVDAESYQIAESRLRIWLSYLQTAAHSPQINSHQERQRLSTRDYFNRCIQVMGYSEQDFDLTKVKLGINEAFMRVRNDTDGIWKYFVVHRNYLQSPGVKKILEVARYRKLRVFVSNDLPCYALVSVYPIKNPNVLSEEIDVSGYY